MVHPERGTGFDVLLHHAEGPAGMPADERRVGRWDC